MIWPPLPADQLESVVVRLEHGVKVGNHLMPSAASENCFFSGVHIKMILSAQDNAKI